MKEVVLTSCTIYKDCNNKAILLGDKLKVTSPNGVKNKVIVYADEENDCVMIRTEDNIKTNKLSRLINDGWKMEVIK